MWQTLFWAAVAFLVGHHFGWQGAHHTVASECERLGGFYVGKTIYKCTAIERPENKDQKNKETKEEQ